MDHQYTYIPDELWMMILKWVNKQETTSKNGTSTMYKLRTVCKNWCRLVPWCFERVDFMNTIGGKNGNSIRKVEMVLERIGEMTALESLNFQQLTEDQVFYINNNITILRNLKGLQNLCIEQSTESSSIFESFTPFEPITKYLDQFESISSFESDSSTTGLSQPKRSVSPEIITIKLNGYIV